MRPGNIRHEEKSSIKKWRNKGKQNKNGIKVFPFRTGNKPQTMEKRRKKKSYHYN